MVFVPQWPNLSSDLLGCLHYFSVDEVPLQWHTTTLVSGLECTKWGMAKTLKGKWEFLKGLIAYLRTSLMKDCLLWLDIAIPWLPLARKYGERHESCYKAKVAIERSRKLFILNMAFLSYMVCLCPSWLHKLDKEVGGVLATNIQNSWIIDPNAAGRVGAFVDVKGPSGNSVWLNDLDKIEKWPCVPVWICYSRDGLYRPWCYIKVARLLPSPVEVQEASSRVYNVSAPVPEKGSGQLRGKNPSDYLQRHKKELAKEAEGSITAQETRDKRCQWMKDYSLPSKAGPAVWLWEE
jgi:hypothetical protein